MNSISQLKEPTKYLMIFLIGVILFRLVLIADVPLLDKTESRYSEIARIMNETNEWVVPQIDYDQPFWAKPPLSTWLSAISFKSFGVNAFAARLPSYLLNLFLIFILSKFVLKDKKKLLLVGFILLTMPEFLLHTGVVSTDTALCFSISIIMISFWKAINKDGAWYWKYLFFVGVALGLLSKGPLVVVLTGPPIFVWLILKRVKIKALFKNLPWLIGLLITVVIAVPWYILTEMRSEGFIDYFIVGEHFKRFLEPKWSGDLYGGPKSQALGMIWVFLFIFTFPWLQIAIYKLWKSRRKVLKDPWLTYLVLWMLWTPLFFTISKNILHTYILPSTIPLALIIVHFWQEIKLKKTSIIVASIFPIAALLFYVGLRFTDKWEPNLNTNKYLLQAVDVEHAPIYFWKQRSYSGEFYSNGNAQLVADESQLDSLLQIHDQPYMLVLNKKRKEIPKAYFEKMKLQDSNYKTLLYRFDKIELLP
ncbi:MAG: glycosyltransferase family 39 protein [Bacteroidia bacterium]|nr:glycosyltransferase family 39 protein [Bacteroidia bacterium]